LLLFKSQTSVVDKMPTLIILMEGLLYFSI